MTKARRRNSASDLTPAQRKRALIALLASTFLTWGGFFVVIPLVAVHYVDDLGWAASSVGLVLAVRQFMQQGSSTFSGALADKLGAKGLICTGLFIRVAGFGIMALADRYWILMLSAIVTALGGGIFESPKAAAVATLTDDSNRRQYYSLMGVLSGLGTALGTLLGALLINRNFASVSLGGAAAFLVAGILMSILLPRIDVATEEKGLFQGTAAALKDRLFVKYAALMMGNWFIATQFSISLVLRATEIAGSDTAGARVFWVQSAVIIVLGFPLPRFFERRFGAYRMLVVGIAFMAVGLGIVARVETMHQLMGAVFVISIGTILSRAGEQIVTAGMAVPASRGAYFGVGALSLAIGGAMGNLVGGFMYDLGHDSGHPEIPWLVFLVIGLCSVFGLSRIHTPVQLALRAPRSFILRAIPDAPLGPAESQTAS